MRSESLVLRNSLWIGLQPLILNIASIAVIGFIARSLGEVDYGRFVFAFSLVALFMPLGNLGLRAVMVRSIAAERERGATLVGQVFPLRLLLAAMAFAALVVTVHAMGYPPSTRFIVYIAGITLLTQSAATTLFDAFQGFERMQYIAYANLISGTTLTALSVLVLLAGFGVVGLTTVYTFGSVVLAVAITLFYRKHLPRFRISIDREFCRQSLVKGMPFFVVGMLSVLNVRMGIVILSKLAGDAAVGQYGAAFNLIERLLVISESLCTAIFPTLSLLYGAAQIDDLKNVLDKYFNYLIVLALPIAIGVTMLSGRIIGLIYGSEYGEAARVLTVLAWNLPFFFLASLMGYCLGAIRRQGLVVRVSIIATVVNLAAMVLLVPRLGAVGVALGYLASGVIASVLTFNLVRRAIGLALRVSLLLRVLGAASALALCVYLLRESNLIVAVAGSGIVYLVALVLFRAMKGDDWRLIREAVIRKRPVPVEQE